MASGPLRFTVHRRRAWPVVAAVLGALVVVESAAVHLALVSHLPVVAWLDTASALWTLVWLVGDVRAMNRTGLEVGDAGLDVRVGRRWRASLPWGAIASLARSASLARAPELVRAGVLGTDVVVELHARTTVRGPLGLRVAARRIALSVDDVDGFLAAAAPHLPPPRT